MGALSLLSEALLWRFPTLVCCLVAALPATSGPRCRSFAAPLAWPPEHRSPVSQKHRGIGVVPLPASSALLWCQHRALGGLCSSPCLWCFSPPLQRRGHFIPSACHCAVHILQPPLNLRRPRPLRSSLCWASPNLSFPPRVAVELHSPLPL